MASNGSLSQLLGGRYLADLWQKDSIQAAFQQRVINAINKLGTSLGANAVGDAAPPDPVEGINISTAGEYMQVNLIHTAPKTRAINYFTEIDTDPNFPSPMVNYQGPSRSMTPTSLPSLDANGNTIKYYVRAYAQYPGSKPSKITTFGGANAPASITLGGKTQMTLLAGTGSGTSSSTGQQGGSGFGIQPTAPLAQGTQASIQTSTVQTPQVTPASGIQTVSAIVDFGSDIFNTAAQVTISATWVKANSIIVATAAGGTTDHPDPDEATVSGIVLAVGNIVPGVSFEVSAYSPYGVAGQFNVNCVGL